MKTGGLRAMVGIWAALALLAGGGLGGIAMADGPASPSSGAASLSDGAGRPADVVLAIDGSLSMGTVPGDSLAGFVARMGEVRRLGVVRFAEAAEVVLPLGLVLGESGRKAAAEVLAGLSFDGRSTDIVAGLEAALEEFSAAGPAPAAASPAPGSGGIVILLTDGKMDPPPGADAGALEARLEATVLPAYRARGLAIFAVAYGDANLPFLRELASATGGLCLAAPGPEALADVLCVLAQAAGAAGPAPLSEPSGPPAGPSPEALPAGPPAPPSLLWPAVGLGGAAAAVSVILTLLLARRALGGAGGKSAPGPAAATAASVGAGLAGEAVPSGAGPAGEAVPSGAGPAGEAVPSGAGPAGEAGLGRVSERLEEIGSELRNVGLDIEDFAARRWQKEKEHEAAYHRVLSGVFLLIDQAARRGSEPAAASLGARALRLLEDEGIEPIPVEPGRDRFDSARHLAVGERPSDLEAGTILEVTRDGYWRRSEEGEGPVVYRPAEVIVSGSRRREGGR